MRTSPKHLLICLHLTLLAAWLLPAVETEVLGQSTATVGNFPVVPSRSILPDATADPLSAQLADQRPVDGAAGEPRADSDPVLGLGTAATVDDHRRQLNAYWEYGPVLESSDKAYRFHFGGRFDFDNSWYEQTATLPFLLQDGVTMRRARLVADGAIGDRVDFVTEVNFANIQDVTNSSTTTAIGSVGLTDFYVTFKQVPILENLRIGHFKQAIGLEHETSANDLYYMERSPGHDAFFQPYQRVTGLKVFDSYWDERATASLTVAQDGKQTITPFAFGTGTDNCVAAGRLTALPIYADEGQRLLHVGIGCSYGGTDHNFELASRPLVRAGAGSQQVPNIIQTGSFFTSDPVQILNAELAAVVGRFALSAEYQFVRATDLFAHYSDGQFSDPRGNGTYQGMYVEMGFFLTPDYRRYDKREGTWDRQIVQSAPIETATGGPMLLTNCTPVQLVCRYSYLDLASGDPVLTSTSGAEAGVENDITAGLDWYINSQVHFVVNYVYTHLDYVDNTSGNINALGCRVHVDF